jgi:thiamine biosynthesis lipoprotein
MRHDGTLDGPLRLRDMALSTSASFGQSERVGLRRIGHIIDPRTGNPLARSAQATVLAPSGAEAEAWSKALLVDPDAALVSLARRPAVAAVVLAGSRRRETANFAARASSDPSRR